MGLIQRVLDDVGLCTISITQVVEITAIVKPSRAIFVAHPFGLTFGAVGDACTQRAVLDALHLRLRRWMLPASATRASAGLVTICGPDNFASNATEVRRTLRA